MKAGIRIFATTMIVLLLDGLTKILAEKLIFSSTPVFGQSFRLTLGYNTGVAFGFFANGGIILLVGTGIIIIGLVVLLLFAFRGGEIATAMHIPIGMFLGGAAANFADRLPDGQVTDFLDFGLGSARWPTFNLADTFIVVGVVILLWLKLRKKPFEQERLS
jgi:signal peptidase II